MARSSHTGRDKKQQGGSRYAALAILAVICIAVGAYLFFTPVVPDVPPPQQAVSKGPSPRPAPPLKPHAAPVQSPAAVNPPKPETSYPAEQSQPDVQPPHVERTSGAGQLAIIIDDMGTTLQEARSLAGIGVPLTFSIIPGLRSYQDVAAFAASNGIETMIHIPMQSKGWPERRLEANGLLVNMGNSDISERMEGFMRSIPKAVGANNHMGSEFTEHEEKMRVVLEALKGKGLYFVDSVTSPKTVAGRMARELGMKTGRRHVFLDNEQNESYILGQLGQAVRMAKKNGAAIAICHPHPVTIRTLQAALPGLERQGVMLVPASRLVGM